MQNDREKFKIDFFKRLIRFSISILKFTDYLSNKRTLWSINDQIVRSATSIGANVIEAKSSSSKKDYIHFFEIALKSANETKYWLILIREYAPETLTEVQTLLNECEEIAKIIAASVLTMKGRN